MSRSRRRYRSGPLLVSGRLPGRVVAAAVGALLVLLDGLLVLAPVLGLVGTAAAAGPVLDAPYGSITAVVVLGYLVALGCLAGAFASHRAAVAWTLAVLAGVVALVVSVWPIIATADAAVDRARDVLPWIRDLVGSVT